MDAGTGGAHAIDFWLSTEDLPSPENRVTLAPDGNVRLTYSETNGEARKRLYETFKSLLPKLNMNEGHLIHRFAYMKNEIPVAGVAHQAGTTRFGTDPAQSVLNTTAGPMSSTTSTSSTPASSRASGPSTRR